VENAKIEPSLAEAKPGEKFQFVRDGYYCMDSRHANTFNRVVGLKDSFPKK
jgi:glutaminyl-tRNA synthetase